MVGAHNAPAYNASKAAVWMLTKSVALYCANLDLNIRCNSIHPAFIDTPFLDEYRDSAGRERADRKMASAIPLKRIGEANDVAFAAVYLASDESKFVTGAELKVDGGTTAQ